jgi:hypothetical protein
MEKLMKWFFVFVMVIGAAGPLFAFGMPELPPLPDPPPTNMATLNDIASLRSEIARLNEQILALQTYTLGLDEYCTKLQNMLTTVARANSFDEVRKLLKDKFGIVIATGTLTVQERDFSARLARISEASRLVNVQRLDIRKIRQTIRPVTPVPGPR